MKIKQFVFLLAIMALLTACFGIGGSKENITRYYLIDSVDNASNVLVTDKALAIRINDIKIPQYLERFQIVTRSAENRLRFSEFNQWGEPLRKNLLRSMSQNLANILATTDIATPHTPSASKTDYTITVSILQFEHDIDGYVKLSATWQISNRNTDTSSAMKKSGLRSAIKVAANDYDAIVNNMQSLYADLSTELANAIYADNQR